VHLRSLGHITQEKLPIVKVVKPPPPFIKGVMDKSTLNLENKPEEKPNKPVFNLLKFVQKQTGVFSNAKSPQVERMMPLTTSSIHF
jgi:hypothetical protein